MNNLRITYDDTQLQALFNELDEKKRVSALKGAFRQQANVFKRTAIANLSRSIRTDKDLASGVRAIVFKRQLGFRVTVGTSGNKKGFHLNRQGLLKPVLIWAEEGTQARTTKNGGGRFHRARRKRKAHATGRMRRYGFMLRTKMELQGDITTNLRNSIRAYVERAAIKNGCKV